MPRFRPNSEADPGVISGCVPASQKSSILPQTQTPKPSWLGELKLQCFLDLGRAQAHSEKELRIFQTSSTQGGLSDNTRGNKRIAAKSIVPGAGSRPPALTQAEAPPRAWRQRQASPSMLCGHRRSNAGERNFSREKPWLSSAAVQTPVGRSIASSRSPTARPSV